MPNIILNGEQPRKIILNGRVYSGSSTDDLVIADIYNHGSIVGLNKIYYGFQKGNSSVKFDLNDNGYIIYNGGYRSDNIGLGIYPPLKNTEYSKIFFDIEVPSGVDGEYNNLSIRAIKHLFPSNANKLNIHYTGVNMDEYGGATSAAQVILSKTLISYVNHYNIDGNDPWYILPRKIQYLELPTDTEYEYYIHIQAGFNQTKIYSIWVEP